MATIDFEIMTNDELINFIVMARREAQRRGVATEAETWAEALADDERTRVAREAAEREAQRLAETERRRIAEEAAAKVRRDVAAKQQAQEADAAARQAAQVRALAVQARELFGSDEAEFKVEIWENNGDKRVYIGHGYDGNWVEYYHTGNVRVAPGTLKTIDAVVKPLAAHLNVTPAETRERIKQFCVDICNGWKTIRIEVSPDNAPLDPTAVVTRYILKRGDRFARDGKKDFYTFDRSSADRFPTAEAALAALPKYTGDRGIYFCTESSAATVEAIPITIRLPFPPKTQG